MPDEIIRLQPGERRLGQNESAELQAAINAVPCPDCGAAISAHCTREGADGRRYETRLAHPKRIKAAAEKRAQDTTDKETRNA